MQLGGGSACPTQADPEGYPACSTIYQTKPFFLLTRTKTNHLHPSSTKPIPPLQAIPKHAPLDHRVNTEARRAPPPAPSAIMTLPLPAPRGAWRGGIGFVDD